MKVEHSIVYAEQGLYAGWPANHGAWQWGNEMLVSFLRGKYKVKSMHHIAKPFEKVLARSLDGGRTWEVEKPNVDSECRGEPSPPPPFNFLDRRTHHAGAIKGLSMYIILSMSDDELEVDWPVVPPVGAEITLGVGRRFLVLKHFYLARQDEPRYLGYVRLSLEKLS